MTKGLKPGIWCRPKNEIEWKCILELAEKLGLRKYDCFDHKYEHNKRIWFSPMCNPCQVYPMFHGNVYGQGELSVTGFVQGMYDEAAKRKQPECTLTPNDVLRLLLTDGLITACQFSDNYNRLITTDEVWSLIQPPSNQLCGVLQLQLQRKSLGINELDNTAKLHEAQIKNLYDRVGDLENKADSFASQGDMLTVISRLREMENNQMSPGAIQDLVQMGSAQERLAELENKEAVREFKEHYPSSVDDMYTSAAAGCKQDPGYLTVAFAGSSCCVVIEKNASPKNIPFSIALEYAKLGRRISNGAFAYGWYWTLLDGVFYSPEGKKIATYSKSHEWDDFVTRTDWEVL